MEVQAAFFACSHNLGRQVRRLVLPKDMIPCFMTGGAEGCPNICSVKKSGPTFDEYQSAQKRLQTRARQRRAVITRGLNASIEMPVLDEQELWDQYLCEKWQEINGFQANHY